MAEVKIEIVSPERLILSETASAVSVPGTDGYFTVMGDHAPLMSTLKAGFVTVTVNGNNELFYVQSGFADVSPDGLTVLAEQARHISEFDRAEIEAALAKAREELAAAQSAEDKNAAQMVISGFENLLVEAQHLAPNIA
jgi:F-type H+-transporting ATPase subunit epsilon